MITGISGTVQYLHTLHDLSSSFGLHLHGQDKPHHAQSWRSHWQVSDCCAISGCHRSCSKTTKWKGGSPGARRKSSITNCRSRECENDPNHSQEHQGCVGADQSRLRQATGFVITAHTSLWTAFLYNEIQVWDAHGASICTAVFTSCERKLKADELLQLSILSLAKIILPSTRGYADYQSAATCSKAKKRDLTRLRPRAIARMESPAWPGRQAADGEAAVNQG